MLLGLGEFLIIMAVVYKLAWMKMPDEFLMSFAIANNAMMDRMEAYGNFIKRQ